MSQMKAQGEFRLKLRQLEDQLLQEISKSQGENILDNDELITQLQNIKNESDQISREIEKSEQIMSEIQTVTNQYLPLANLFSSLFFLIKSLDQLNHSYQFSLEFYSQIIDETLEKDKSLREESHQD